MSFQVTEDRIVFEGKDFIVVLIQDLLPTHKNFPRGAHHILKPWSQKPAVRGAYQKHKGRHITKLYCHQTAGSVTANGFDAPVRTTQFVVNDPAWVNRTIKFQTKWVWTGRGRGWPGCCYTYYIPYHPISHKGKIVIFQCWDNDWITWHSSDNAHSIAIVCQGYFRSRHMRTFKAKKGCPTGAPSPDQLTALEGFVLEYAIDHLHIEHDQILGHYDSPHPKATCPGDDIEKYVEGVKQGKAAPSIEPDDAPPMPLLAGSLILDTWEERQAALLLLGHDLGEYGKLQNGVDGDPGYLTRLAIEATEETFGLPIDGYWDDTFDFVLKTYLLGLGIGDKEILAEIP